VALSEWGEPRIRGVLPHRDRMLLVRRAALDDERPRGRATLALEEGAWGAELLCPHLYLVEALAQLAGLALAAAAGEGGPAVGYLAEVPEMRFDAPLRPGDEVDLEADLEISFGPLARFLVSARRGGSPLLSGTVTIAVA